MSDTEEDIYSDENEEISEELTFEEEFEYYETHIRNIWDKIILKYVKDVNNKEMLFNLDEHSYNKWYDYMITNNEYLSELHNEMMKEINN